MKQMAKAADMTAVPATLFTGPSVAILFGIKTGQTEKLRNQRKAAKVRHLPPTAQELVLHCAQASFVTVTMLAMQLLLIVGEQPLVSAHSAPLGRQARPI